MPSTSDARAARWPGMDQQAMEHLERQGFKLTRAWEHELPSRDYHVTARDFDALLYLFEEWDFAFMKLAPDQPLFATQPDFTEADFDQAYAEAVAREGAWRDPEPA